MKTINRQALVWGAGPWYSRDPSVHRIDLKCHPIESSQYVLGNRSLCEATWPGQGLAKVIQLAPESVLDVGAADFFTLWSFLLCHSIDF